MSDHGPADDEPAQSAVDGISGEPTTGIRTEIGHLFDELALVFSSAQQASTAYAGAAEPVRPGPALVRRPRAAFERDERPLFVLGVSTWNREEYVRRFVESFVATRSDDFNWVLVIADDGSTDGTLDYLDALSIPDCQVVVVQNKRRTIAGQANTILQVADALAFDFGMKCDDDIYFTAPGWDHLYFDAATSTGMDHLVYHNTDWKPAKHDIDHEALHSSVAARDCLGCLYTFTPAVIASVGFMDGAEFRFRGHSHIDFTVRCCRAGFNDEDQLWDAAGSAEHVAMWSRDEYVNLVDWNSPQVKAVLNPEERARRMALIDQPDRVFVPPTAADLTTPRSRFTLSPHAADVVEALQVVPTLQGPTEMTTSAFDGVFVLNLDHDVEKWAITAAMLAAHDVDFERFPGVDGNAEEVAAQWRSYAAAGLTHELERKISRKLIQSPGAWGYLLAMEALLEAAKARRLRRIVVFDDDIMLHCDFAAELKAAWAELTPHWKLFYLGRSQVEREAETTISDRLVHPGQGANGSFAVALDASVYDLALREIRRFEWPFDSGALREIDRTYPDETLAAEPPLVIADVSESAIRRARNIERFAETHGWTIDDYQPRAHTGVSDDGTPPPLVTVIVPCHGDEPTIGDALTSLRRQTYGRVEIITVIAEPTARMIEALQRLRARDSRIRILTAFETDDDAAALNAALAISQGEILIVHAPTEVSATDRIAQAVAALEAEGATWVAAPAVRVDSLPPGGQANGADLERWVETAAVDDAFQSYRVGAFRRDLLAHAGGVLAGGETGIRELIERTLRWPKSESTGLREAPPVQSLAAALLDRDLRYAPSVDLSRWRGFHVEIASGIRPPRMTPSLASVVLAGSAEPEERAG